jgi:hypothetical protein
MPVDVQLSENKRHLVYTITDPLKIEELLEAYQREKALRDSIPYTLHSIVDMSQVKNIPASWLTAKAGPGLTHPRAGMLLMVGLSPGIQMIVKVIMQVMRFTRVKSFKTRDEANEFLQTLLADETQTNSPSA